MRKEADLEKVKRTVHLFPDLDVQLTDDSPWSWAIPSPTAGLWASEMPAERSPLGTT